MGILIPYNSEVLESDTLKLSLAEAGRKYKNWVKHENGAYIFGQLTLTIAVRQLVIHTRAKNIKFESLQEVYDAFNALRQKYSYLDDSLATLLRGECFGYGLSDELRVFTVRHHASGWTTSQVLDLILPVDGQGVELTPLEYYARYYGLRQGCRDYLSRQLNYLKRGNPRWPKKYDAVWDEARAAVVRAARDIPLTHITEQVAALSAHYAKLTDAFDALPLEPEYSRDRAVLTRAMSQTLSGLYTLTRDPALPKPNHTALGNTEPVKAVAPSVRVAALTAGEEGVSDAQTTDPEKGAS